MHYLLSTLDDTDALAKCISQSICADFIIILNGDLGAGKTTLVRSILRNLGVVGSIKSPTFTIVEPYQINHQYIYHFDLYRFSEPSEWYELGFEEYFTSGSICFIEWPDRANDLIPQVDWEINLEIYGLGRKIEIISKTEKGDGCLSQLTRCADVFFN